MLDQPITKLRLPEAFADLAKPARYKAFYGGRGSAKSHSFATQLILDAIDAPHRVLCAREVQKSIRESVKLLLDDTIDAAGLRYFFKSTETEIVGLNGSRFFFAGLRSHPANIKSMEGLTRCWIEEASAVSQRSLQTIKPTLRTPGSQLWASWNPESEFDAIELEFRGKMPPENAIVRHVTWKDNPWFPDVLKEEMRRDYAKDPEAANHIWLGAYRQAPHGSYYGKLLAIAFAAGRIKPIAHDPMLPVHAAFDLGVGQNMSVWFSQWAPGGDIRVIDYLEGDDDAVVEGFAWFVRKMKSLPYTYGNVIFPHDGRVHDIATGKTRQEMMEAFGFRVEICPQIGVAEGIDATKRFLSRAYIDAHNCAPGLKALREYRENWDDDRKVSMGPLKDWTNHAADAMRMLAVSYEAPKASPVVKKTHHARPGGWMR